MERFGDFELLIELATGGMATVHVARHQGDGGFERLVAIKRVHRHLLKDPEVFAMLSDEARLSALVRHPNVVATHQVIDKDGELLLVQEYVEGVSLALLAKRAARTPEGRLPTEVAVQLIVDLLRGLHAAHEAVDLRGEPLRLVHRDVSPQNVMVGADGVARLIDFGIARAEGRLAETRSGIIKGKLAYMAPEQVAEGEVDRRADLFAVGVVLHELVAGPRPFEGGGDVERMARLLLGSADLKGIEQIAPGLAPILATALARDRDDRFATAEAMGEALRDAARPVPDGEMRALVQALVGDELAARREAIRDAMGHAEAEAAVRAEVAAALVEPAVRAGPSEIATEPLPQPGGSLAATSPESTRRWRGVALLALVAIVSVAAAVTGASSRGDGRGADERAATASATLGPSPATPSTSSAPAPTVAIPTASSATASSATANGSPAKVISTGSPAGRAPSAPFPTASASASASSTATSAPSSELHGNPYGR